VSQGDRQAQTDQHPIPLIQLFNSGRKSILRLSIPPHFFKPSNYIQMLLVPYSRSLAPGVCKVWESGYAAQSILHLDAVLVDLAFAFVGASEDADLTCGVGEGWVETSGCEDCEGPGLVAVQVFL